MAVPNVRYLKPSKSDKGAMTDRDELLRRHRLGMEPVKPIDPGPLDVVGQRNKERRRQWQLRMTARRITEIVKAAGATVEECRAALRGTFKYLKRKTKRRSLS